MSTFNIIPQSSTRLCVFNVRVCVGNINFCRNGKSPLAEQTGKQMTWRISCSYWQLLLYCLCSMCRNLKSRIFYIYMHVCAPHRWLYFKMWSKGKSFTCTQALHFIWLMASEFVCVCVSWFLIYLISVSEHMLMSTPTKLTHSCTTPSSAAFRALDDTSC